MRDEENRPDVLPEREKQDANVGTYSEQNEPPSQQRPRELPSFALTPEQLKEFLGTRRVKDGDDHTSGREHVARSEAAGQLIDCGGTVVTAEEYEREKLSAWGRRSGVVRRRKRDELRAKIEPMLIEARAKHPKLSQERLVATLKKEHGSSPDKRLPCVSALVRLISEMEQDGRIPRKMN